MNEPIPIQSVIVDSLSQLYKSDLLKHAKTRRFEKGQTIFTQGDEGDWMLFIQKGKIEISVTSADGRKSVLNHMGEGDMLGEIALLDHEKRSADAVALTDIEGALIHRHEFKSFLEHHHDACFSLIQTLCSRVRNASEMFETRTLSSSSARLARCLLRIGKKWGEPHNEGLLIKESLSQTELGELSGIARENVNRLLKHWADEGWVQYDKTHIVLLNLTQLHIFAG